MLIDLHTHSYPQSDDAFMAVDELIDTARSRGLDGVCLTDHDRFWPEAKTRELSRKHQFLVLSGSEINTDAGHVLVFGLDEYVFGLHKPLFLHEKVVRRGGAMVAAHPHRRRFLEDPGHIPEMREGMLETATRDRIFQMCQAVEGPERAGDVGTKQVFPRPHPAPWGENGRRERCPPAAPVGDCCDDV